MKKIIILLLALLMSACAAVKPSETLSSMQTEPTETTDAETAVPMETTEPISKGTEPVIETPKTETTAPSGGERPEQKAVRETSTATTVETPVVPIKAETTTKPSATPKTPVETIKEDKPTELPESAKSPSESVTEPPKAELDVSTTGSASQGLTRFKSDLRWTKRR